jgi:hypothetical protein
MVLRRKDALVTTSESEQWIPLEIGDVLGVISPMRDVLDLIRGTTQWR